MSFKFFKQLNAMDCGPTCLRMIAAHYGKQLPADKLRKAAGFSKEGVSLLGLSEAAESIGFHTRGVHVSLSQLVDNSPLPCILHWNGNHFVVLIKATKKNFLVADPGQGIITYTKSEITSYWANNILNNGVPIGMGLLLEPSPFFFNLEEETQKNLNWSLVGKYLSRKRLQILQVLLILSFSSMLQLIFPFLTQSIVDTGVNNRDMTYITVVLAAQLMLIFSRTVLEFLKTRVLLKISATINLSILSDFWIKLTRLPVNYFDTHHTGDIIQRINDHKQIQGFLTGPALYTLFSFFSLLIFGFTLSLYSTLVFIVFLSGSILYILWIRFFLGIRRKLNYSMFTLSAKENASTLQLVQGMQEIKLNGAEHLKRWEWENIQSGIFKLNFRSLSYSQIQQSGALLINQGKDVLITFIVAGLVVKGQITLGGMLAIQYIIGQLNGPIEQLISFVQSAQDAKISMERLNDIHNLADEEKLDVSYTNNLPSNKALSLSRLSFAYPGTGGKEVISNLTLNIPVGCVTAIVGYSGSGKTTLLKLLLKFYDEYGGTIKVGDTPLEHISHSFWRKQCGAVLQDGFVFNDTIANNIAVGETSSDYNQLIKSARTANILEFIESLPNGFHTQLGAYGIGISQGQKQRLLIARAVYKNPQFIFFDEATNALDASNERTIVENLTRFFKGRTVVVVAHRLSTVKHADNIIVLHQGNVVEQGTHEELSLSRGLYFELVKDQLELANN